jgi:TRAP-type C4-dicarboxylate transport system permease large subunit
MDFKKTLLRYKPGVSIKTHLFSAGLIWSLVGCGLLIFGLYFISLGGNYWYAVAGLILGTVKAIFVLDRAARKNVKRIEEFEDKVCLGSVYSWKTWLLVVAMILLGRFLRGSTLPREIIGLVYVAVGWALLLASRLMWLTWKRTLRT